MTSIPFTFQNQPYYTLIRTRRKEGRIEMRVTIMNGELEKALHGHNVFECRNGYVIADYPVDPTVAKLKSALVDAINGYLRQHPLEFMDHSV